MRRRTRCAAVLAVVLLGAPVARAQNSAAKTREFPTYDRPIAAMVARGEAAKRASRFLADGRVDGDISISLVDADRLDVVVALMARKAQAPVAELISVLRAVSASGGLFRLRSDDSGGVADKLREIVQQIRGRLAGLPREDAARLAMALMSVEGALGPAGSVAWRQRLDQFVKDYAGTDEALLAEVETSVPERANTAQRVEAYDRFAREHPGTTAGALALYQRGSTLTHNSTEARGGDPAPRFDQVRAIVAELTSGRYPASEWVQRAPNLLTEFYFSRDRAPAFAPGSLDRMIDGFRDHVFAHFDGGDNDTLNNGIGYVIGSKLADLYAFKGERVGGLETFLTELERRVVDKPVVRLLRAEFYLRESIDAPAPDRAAMRVKARDALTLLAAERSTLASRRALATLATMAQADRDHAAALSLYRRYASMYPDSAYAWVAALRVGHMQAALNQWTEAHAAFQNAARLYSDEPLARVLGAAYAGRALEALGEIPAARDAYRRAFDQWDLDYGTRIDIRAWQPLNGFLIPPSSTEVTRDGLTARLVHIDRALAMPGGLNVERARSQIARGLWDEAEKTLRTALQQYASSPAAPEARRLLHRAQLERVLTTISGAVTSDADAVVTRQLDEIAAEPPDFFVAAARLVKAAIDVRNNQTDAARAETRTALDQLISMQKPFVTATPASDVDADIAAIRRVVFRPLGDLTVFGGGRWNAFTFPATLPSFVIVKADVDVKLGQGPIASRTVYQSFTDMPNGIFLVEDELTFLSRVIEGVGGTARRAPTQVMETPNQPIGVSLAIIGVWNEFFPTRPGHWGGWELETYPQITRIEFIDEARTKANVMVTVGYSGATVVMEKVKGVWTAIRLTNQWIT